MLKYIPFFPDMLTDHFEDLTDGEIGLIVKAALVYAADGTEPVFERRSVLALTWKRIRAHIDQCAAKSETQSANGSKGGRPKSQQNPEKPNETQINPRKPSETQNNHIQEQEQEQDQDQEQEHTQEQEQEQKTSAPAPAPLPEGRVISLDDGTAAARRLVTTYMPPSRSPGRDLRVDQIGEMIRSHGQEAVEAAMREATGSDSRGGLSVNFVRSVLERRGRSPGYQRRAYSSDEYAAMEVDLRAELDAQRAR